MAVDLLRSGKREKKKTLIPITFTADIHLLSGFPFFCTFFFLSFFISVSLPTSFSSVFLHPSSAITLPQPEKSRRPRPRPHSGVFVNDQLAYAIFVCGWLPLMHFTENARFLQHRSYRSLSPIIYYYS